MDLNKMLKFIPKKYISSFFSTSYGLKTGQDLEKADLAFLTLDDAFGHAIRGELSKLSNLHSEVLSIDLGILEDKNKLIDFIDYLISIHVIPVVIGMSADDFKAFISQRNTKDKGEKATYISPVFHAHGSHIAFQRHLLSLSQIEDLGADHFRHLSLGALRREPHLLEPILRESSHVFFDLSAIRHSDCPSVSSTLPTGLFSEEACQIMRFIGENTHLKFVAIPSLNLTQQDRIDAMMVAELIWYLVEGLALNPGEHPAISNEFVTHVVEMNDHDYSVYFYQCKKSGKWWIRPNTESNKFYPCTEDDYHSIVEGEIPDWVLPYII